MTFMIANLHQGSRVCAGENLMARCREKMNVKGEKNKEQVKQVEKHGLVWEAQADQLS